jgi:putative flippase GtrA
MNEARMNFGTQFGLFVLAGGVSAACNWGSRFLFSLWFSYPVAIVLAYLVGMATAFVLMRQHVFDGRGKPLGRQVIGFTLVNMYGMTQTLVISLVLARWALPALGIDRHVEAIAHLLALSCLAGTSYVGHRFFSFR